MRTRAVQLTWEWPGQLAADEYFDVRVWFEDQQPLGVAWTKATAYPLYDHTRPEWLRDPGPSGAYHWSVAVLKGHFEGTDGVPDTFLAESSSRTFIWYPRPPPAPPDEPSTEPTRSAPPDPREGSESHNTVHCRMVHDSTAGGG